MSGNVERVANFNAHRLYYAIIHKGMHAIPPFECFRTRIEAKHRLNRLHGADDYGIHRAIVTILPYEITIEASKLHKKIICGICKKRFRPLLFEEASEGSCIECLIEMDDDFSGKTDVEGLTHELYPDLSVE